MTRVVWKPNPGPQTAFLASTAREVLYGGAVFGGKSDALVAAPLRWADHSKHRALIMRRTRPQLQEVIDRSQQLYPDIVPGAQWREAESRWKFPNGAIIQFGYAEHERDIMNFKSFQYNWIGFDELTSFTEYQYKFMLLRNRTTSSELPLQVRSGTNPGDIGHEWVFRRFMDGKRPYQVYRNIVEFDKRQLVTTQQFIPSFAWDNPAAPQEVRDAYIAGVLQLQPEDVAAYLYGEWSKLAGAMFKVPMVMAATNDFLDSKDYFVVRCIDYGIDDPTCILWLAYYPKLDIVDVLAEVYVREVELDGIVRYAKAKEAEMKIKPPIFSVGSPEMTHRQATSGTTIATMLTVRGVYVERGNTDRMAGWAKIINLLVRGALRVWPGGDQTPFGAPNLVRTLPRLQRNTGIGKDPNDLRPRQEDHAADALRYGVMAIYEFASVAPKPAAQEDDPNRDYVFDKLRAEWAKPKTPWIPDLGAF